MAAKVKRGNHVFAKATEFDSPEGPRLSQEVFGGAREKEMCRGIVEGLKSAGQLRR